MFGTLIQWINDCHTPFVLTYVAVYTLLAESVPLFVTKNNSNAWTSQMSWNVTLKSLRFQIVNYIIYHEKKFSIVVHAITFLMDAVLWTIYFHHLLVDVPVWAYCFLFSLTSFQILTYDDNKLKIVLILINLTLVAVGDLLYTLLLLPYLSREPTFGIVSILLFVNAFLRAVSHIPERLPINYYGLGNKIPIKNWFLDPKARNHILSNPYIVTSSFIWGIATELQAGVPLRLLSSCLVLLVTKLSFVFPGLDMDEIYQRAQKISDEGWHVDDDGRNLFPSHKEKSM
ncbi:hypothetical protein AKO1_011636 [Acrasis kona]|uniref:Uncharacterized protein n=1 Tax=Acrasis kona TaxID=1008807 RepID=A0AAW2Z5M6_9EUKA